MHEDISMVRLLPDVWPQQGTLQDYQEMFIQFGYVVLFSSAFPLAAMCALINNIIEIRSDALKLCTGLQRPFGQRVENIGQWQVRIFLFKKKVFLHPVNIVFKSLSWFSPFFSMPDCNGGHGLNSHHSELLLDWSVRAASASVPLAESWNGHHLNCLTWGRCCSAMYVCPSSFGVWNRV